jgi:hypothetical protein
MKNVIFFGLIVTMCSCQKILIRIAGLRAPQIESNKSVRKFVSQIHGDTMDIYCLDSTLFEQLRNIPFKPGWTAGLRPMQFRVYDKYGKPIVHYASCEGRLKDLKPFDTVPPRNQVNLDSTLNLQEDLDRYFTLDGQKASIKYNPGYDFYFVVYVSRYTPRMSKSMCKAINKYRRTHPELKIKIYMVDTDVMDWWNTEIESDFKIH